MEDTTQKEIERRIKEIVEKIPKGCIFDAHFVIERILRQGQKSANLYLNYASKTISNRDSQISKIIGSFKKLVEPVMDGEKEIFIWSYNVLDKPSQCKAWRRKK